MGLPKAIISSRDFFHKLIPSLENFVNKTIGNRKKIKPTIVISVVKVDITIVD